MLPRRTVAALLLAVGLLAATIAYGAWCLRVTALDSARVAATAPEVLRAPRARDTFVTRLADSMASQLPPGIVDRAGLEKAADVAIDQPAFQTAFAGALEQLHRLAFEGGDGNVVLDVSAVTEAARAGLATVDPGAAALLPTTPTVNVQVDAGEIPDLTDAPRGVDLTMVLAGVLAAVLVSIGTAIHPYRPWAVARIGRWMIGVSIAQLLLFWALPKLVILTLSGWGPVAAEEVLGLFPAVLPAAVALLLGGGIVVTVTARWAKAHPTRRSVLHAVAPPLPGNAWTRV